MTTEKYLVRRTQNEVFPVLFCRFIKSCLSSFSCARPLKEKISKNDNTLNESPRKQD